MSPEALFSFFKLCALRIAKLPSGSRSLGTYRTLVRQYAEDFGIRTEIATADDPMLAALDLLWEEGYLLLDKWDDRYGWTVRAQYASINHFAGCGGFRVRLTSKGQELFAHMESQVQPTQPVNNREIGFHASL